MINSWKNVQTKKTSYIILGHQIGIEKITLANSHLWQYWLFGNLFLSFIDLKTKITHFLAIPKTKRTHFLAILKAKRTHFLALPKVYLWPYQTFKMYFKSSITDTGPSFSAYAKCSGKPTFLTPWYAHVRVPIRGLEILVCRKSLHTVRTNWMIPFLIGC